VVTVKEFRSRNVFVGGEVVAPSMLYFEVIPDLWEAIKLAGGPSELADLSNITVLRSNEAGGGVINVDLADILSSGELDRLPALHSGYTVTVQQLPAGSPASRIIESSQRRKVFYIYGDIALPGRHPMDTEVDLLEALVLAGGPGPKADLRKVRVVSKGLNGSLVRVINLESYGETGGPYRYMIQREDAVIIPTKKTGFFSGTWGAFRDLLALTGTVSSLILILSN
jgi:protein involved in polysaccharide export with SLBB domain